jgi:hypothetical protein
MHNFNAFKTYFLFRHEQEYETANKLMFLWRCFSWGGQIWTLQYELLIRRACKKYFFLSLSCLHSLAVPAEPVKLSPYGIKTHNYLQLSTPTLTSNIPTKAKLDVKANSCDLCREPIMCT